MGWVVAAADATQRSAQPNLTQPQHTNANVPSLFEHHLVTSNPDPNYNHNPTLPYPTLPYPTLHVTYPLSLNSSAKVVSLSGRPHGEFGLIVSNCMPNRLGYLPVSSADRAGVHICIE